MISEKLEIKKGKESVVVKAEEVEVKLPKDKAKEFGLFVENFIPTMNMPIEVEEQMYKISYELQSL